MLQRRLRDRWRRLHLVIAALAVAAAAALANWSIVAALDCEGILIDDGCLFTITGGDTTDPDDGYAVTNADGVPLWDFVRERDLQAIGHPISQRWVSGPFTLQAFQKVILQWDPGKGRMNYYNTLDVLANRYPEVELPNVPPHQVLQADRGASFATITRNHLALLEQNAAIKERFLGEPDWLNLYGLPIRYEEREVDGNPQGLQMLRAQRTVFVIWNVPAPGTTVGRVNLQNVPDKVKKLSNVIIPDGAKALRKELDPSLRDALASLAWVADGITPVEEAAITHLERIVVASEDLFRYLINYTHNRLVRAQPTEASLSAFQSLADIAEFPWVQDGLTPGEHTLARRLYDTIDEIPTFVILLSQKLWVRDGVIGQELDVIDDLIVIGRRERRTLEETQPGHTGPTIAASLLNMPFLNTIEPYDPLATDSLRRIGYSNRDHLHRIVSHPSLQHGITEHHARIVIVLRYVMARDPSLLDTMFDTSKTWIEERLIVLPHTGPTFLAVIRSQRGHEPTMNYLEEAVRFAEGFMARPLPTNYIVLLVSDAAEPWAGQFTRWHFTIRTHYDDPSDHQPRRSSRLILHEVAHYYWHVCPSWICEGAAEFFEMHSGKLGSSEIERRAKDCEGIKIQDIASGWHSCHYYLSARLFFDLYHSLGHDLFVQSFQRLNDSLRSGPSPESCEGIEYGLCHLRFAFVTQTTPEAAAVAEEFIARWYFGRR